jgi:4-hydroxy-3-methylbut-2-enyl diphosphate reductase
MDEATKPLKIALTSGASCPDALVDEVLMHLLSFAPGHRSVDEVMEPFREQLITR